MTGRQPRDVRPVATEVGKDAGVVALRVFEGLSKKRQAVEHLVGVDRCGGGEEGRVQPSGVSDDRVEGVGSRRVVGGLA